MILFFEKAIGYSNMKIIITTGFLGAFTTFSTFSFETIMLIEDKSYLIAGLNIFTNLFLGLVAVMLGIFLARTF
jgi:CrcB protein